MKRLKLWVVVGGSWIVFRNTRRARIELRRKVASLTTEDIRTRLVQEGYFTGRTGRPEAVDSIDEIFALLDTLARRSRAQEI